MSLDERLLKCLGESGIEISEDGEMMNVDSISFIRTIVALEEEFSIEIPEEFLLFESLNTIDKLRNIVSNLV